MAAKLSIKNTILRWLPAVAWMALIFWLSAQPDLPRPASNLLNLVLRKCAHFGAYAVLALCYLYALRGTGSVASQGWLALMLAVMYAISDEYHQSWTPRRYPSATDVLIDSAGAITAVSLWSWLGGDAIVERARSWAAGRGRVNAEKRA